MHHLFVVQSSEDGEAGNEQTTESDQMNMMEAGDASSDAGRDLSDARSTTSSATTEIMEDTAQGKGSGKARLGQE